MAAMVCRRSKKMWKSQKQQESFSSVEPLDPGQGREVGNKIKGGAIPKEFIPGVEKGVLSVAESGILAGFPVIDYKVTTTMVAVHPAHNIKKVMHNCIELHIVWKKSDFIIKVQVARFC